MSAVIQKKLVVFDWDGTLFNSLAWITRCLQKSAENFGLPVPSDFAISRLVGLGGVEVVSRLFPSLDTSEKQNALIEAYRHEYQTGTEDVTGLFPGVIETLDALKFQGYQFAIATGKGRRELMSNLEKTQLGHYFSVSYCAEESISKPHPQMMLNILGDLQVAPEDAVMVGDTEFDMQFGFNSGVYPIAVSYGAHDRAHLLSLGVEHCCDDIRELPLLMEKLFHNKN